MIGIGHRAGGVDVSSSRFILHGLGLFAGAECSGGFVGIALLLLTTVCLGVVFGALSNSVGMAVLPQTFMSTIFRSRS